MNEEMNENESIAVSNDYHQHLSNIITDKSLKYYSQQHPESADEADFAAHSAKPADKPITRTAVTEYYQSINHRLNKIESGDATLKDYGLNDDSAKINHIFYPNDPQMADSLLESQKNNRTKDLKEQKGIIENLQHAKVLDVELFPDIDIQSGLDDLSAEQTDDDDLTK